MSLTDLISPSASWTANPGTSWAGRSVPTESASQIGSGWTQKVICVPDVPRKSWLTSDDGDFEITVAAEHGDSSWINEVEFWLEGTTVTVSTQSKSARTGTIGYSCVIDQSAISADGDAELYVKVRPVNGYERLIGPITFHLNYNGGTNRPNRYCDWENGDDSYDGTSATYVSGSIGPWKTLQKACLSSPDAAIVTVASGNYLEDSNTGTLPSHDSVLEFKLAPGLSLGDVVVDRSSRTSPAKFLLWRRRHIQFNNIHFNTENIDYFWGSYPGGSYNYKGCEFIDANGVTGPTTSYYVPTEAGQYLFRANEGQWNFLQDCDIQNYIAAGASMYLNTTAQTSTDSLFFDAGNALLEYNGVLNYNVSQTLKFEQRTHPETSLTITNAVYSSPNTTLTFSGSPSLVGFPETLRFLSGSLLGQEFSVVSQDDGTDTVVVAGDASAAVSGDTCWMFLIFHADSFQFSLNANYENILLQRYKAIGVTAQPWLFQPGNGNQIKDVGIQVSIFNHTGGGNEISQWQHGHVHVVMRQLTHLGTSDTFRADNLGFSLSDCVVVDSIWQEMDSTGTFPTSGVTIDNNHFIEGTERGTRSAGGSATFDTSYKPTGGVYRRSDAKIQWDAYGDEYFENSLIGAIASEISTSMTNPPDSQDTQSAMNSIKTDCDTLNALGLGTSTITATDFTLQNLEAGLAVQFTNQSNLNTDNSLSLTLSAQTGQLTVDVQNLYDNNVSIEAALL